MQLAQTETERQLRPIVTKTANNAYENGQGKCSISNSTLPRRVYTNAATITDGVDYPGPVPAGYGSASVCRLRGIYSYRQRCRRICRRGPAWSREPFDASSAGR